MKSFMNHIPNLSKLSKETGLSIDKLKMLMGNSNTEDSVEDLTEKMFNKMMGD